MRWIISNSHAYAIFDVDIPTKIIKIKTKRVSIAPTVVYKEFEAASKTEP